MSERWEQIAKDKYAEPGTKTSASLGNTRSHQNGHQNGGNGFQRANEHDAKNADTRPLGNKESETGTNDKTYEYAEHKACLTPLAENAVYCHFFEFFCKGTSFLDFCRKNRKFFLSLTPIRLKQWKQDSRNHSAGLFHRW